MQAGFGSGAQSHVSYGRNEPALTHHHQSIRQALGLVDIDQSGVGASWWISPS
jgi:hypothetical protein